MACLEIVMFLLFKSSCEMRGFLTIRSKMRSSQDVCGDGPLQLNYTHYFCTLIARSADWFH